MNLQEIYDDYKKNKAHYDTYSPTYKTQAKPGKKLDMNTPNQEEFTTLRKGATYGKKIVHVPRKKS